MAKEAVGHREAVYNVESHAEAVRRTQEEGKLVSRHIILDGLAISNEEGSRWYLLYYHDTYYIFVSAQDCDEKVLNTLRRDDKLRVVYEPKTRPDVFDGRESLLIAAVYKGRKAFYRSPGFDPVVYRQQNKKAQ